MNKKMVVSTLGMIIGLSYMGNTYANLDVSALNSCGTAKCVSARDIVNTLNTRYASNKRLLDPFTMVYGDSKRTKDIKADRDALIADFQVDVLGVKPSTEYKKGAGLGLYSKMEDIIEDKSLTGLEPFLGSNTGALSTGDSATTLEAIFTFRQTNKLDNQGFGNYNEYILALQNSGIDNTGSGTVNLPGGGANAGLNGDSTALNYMGGVPLVGPDGGSSMKNPVYVNNRIYFQYYTPSGMTYSYVPFNNGGYDINDKVSIFTTTDDVYLAKPSYDGNYIAYISSTTTDTLFVYDVVNGGSPFQIAGGTLQGAVSLFEIGLDNTLYFRDGNDGFKIKSLPLSNASAGTPSLVIDSFVSEMKVYGNDIYAHVSGGSFIKNGIELFNDGYLMNFSVYGNHIVYKTSLNGGVDYVIQYRNTTDINTVSTISNDSNSGNPKLFEYNNEVYIVYGNSITLYVKGVNESGMGRSIGTDFYSNNQDEYTVDNNGGVYYNQLNNIAFSIIN